MCMYTVLLITIWELRKEKSTGNSTIVCRNKIVLGVRREALCIENERKKMYTRTKFAEALNLNRTRNL